MRFLSMPMLGWFLLTPPAALAAGLEGDLNARWRGAWVILKVESYSNCDSSHTNNQVNGQLVSSKGRHAFPAGELAKVKKLDLKRARVDVLLEVAEPRLVAFEDGPFRLFNEAFCLEELMVRIPREDVKGKDLAALEDALSAVMERHTTRDKATASPNWNRRKRRPFPEDYQRTLAEYSQWKEEQRLLAIRERIDESLDKAAAILRGVSPNAEYADGFTYGIESMRDARFGDCGQLMSGSFYSYQKNAPQGSFSQQWKEGYREGQQLTYFLELARRLSPCLEEAP